VLAAWPATSRAEPPTTFPNAPQTPQTIEETRYVPPNRAILWSGIGGFLGAYIPAVIVAIGTSNTENNRLYYPVAGPWLDLAKRPQCGSSPRTSCATEDWYEALLVIDGVVQALGVGAIAVGAVVPEKRTRVVTATRPKPRVGVAPLFTRSAYGLTAFGDF
jgi:hypothetical protein